MVLCMDLSEISASAFEATKPWPDPPSSSGSLCSLCRRPRPGCSYPASPRSTTSWWRQPKSRWRCFYTSSLVIWLLLGSFGHLNFKKWKNQVGSKKLFCATFLSRIGTIHWRRQQIFTNFDLYPPPSAVFYYYPSANWANFLPLPP